MVGREWPARGWIALVCAILCLLALPQAEAGSRQNSGAALFTTEQLATFSKQVERYAGTQGAKVFLLARLGTPASELPKGVQFTHVGIAVYSRISTQDGRALYGYAIHNLYQKQDDLSRSELVVDYPLDFFAGAVELKAGIIIPTPILQDKLIAALESGTAQQLHNPRYSLLSNPHSSHFQNCTEHVLDVLFAAIYNTRDIRQIKLNEQTYFKPQKIELSPLKRLLAPLVSEEVSLSDQDGAIRTTTFSAIASFLRSQGMAAGYTVIEEDGTPISF